MTTYKVSELTGGLLDAAVAKAEGLPVHPGREQFFVADSIDTVYTDQISPSRLWEHGGPIIERERLCVYWQHDVWVAGYQIEAENGAQISDVSGWDAATIEFRGCSASASQPLIAAMRAYVASKFGNTVDLP